MTDILNGAPPPNMWHPDVPRSDTIAKWLERGPMTTFRIPLLPANLFDLDAAPDDGTTDTMTITLHRAWARAPYVGRPFVYMWWVGDAGWGRYITSDSHILYGPPGLDYDHALWRGGEPADDSEGWR